MGTVDITVASSSLLDTHEKVASGQEFGAIGVDANACEQHATYRHMVDRFVIETTLSSRDLTDVIFRSQDPLGNHRHVGIPFDFVDRVSRKDLDTKNGVPRSTDGVGRQVSDSAIDHFFDHRMVWVVLGPGQGCRNDCRDTNSDKTEKFPADPRPIDHCDVPKFVFYEESRISLACRGTHDC
jgi:hypothetical protein